MEIIFIWLLFSVLVGAFGNGKSIGFGGAFFLSLLLSPLVGLIIVLVSGPKKEESKYQFDHQEDMELAKIAEFKGNTAEALDHYMNALYKLKNRRKLPDWAHGEKQKIADTETVEAKVAELKAQL